MSNCVLYFYADVVTYTHNKFNDNLANTYSQERPLEPSKNFGMPATFIKQVAWKDSLVKHADHSRNSKIHLEKYKVFHLSTTDSNVELVIEITEDGAMWISYWGRVTHICVGKLATIGSDNGLSPGRRQAIIWTNDGILLIRTLGTNFSEILNEIHSFSFKKTHLKMSSAKWRLSRLGLNELRR